MPEGEADRLALHSAFGMMNYTFGIVCGRNYMKLFVHKLLQYVFYLHVNL